MTKIVAVTACPTGIAHTIMAAEGLEQAAKDPLRVIPVLMLGSAIAGAISMAAGCELRVPHGGAFVLAIPNVLTNLGPYLIAIVAGTLATATALFFLKRPVETRASSPARIRSMRVPDVEN